jgi:A/G-specific adenine glycosylase
VLVSEFMLQQTRVEAVVPFFEAWMLRFPNVASLAEAREDDVLGAWAGLGYYARARHLRGAAREVVAVHAGEIPSDPDLLRALPGVGEYTAAAVASIAFGSPMAAVDGNVRRVLARLADEAQPSPREVGQWAAALLDRREPGTFNQAMMELGATVCTPRGARCDRCPVARFCGARAAGTVAERPARRSRRPSPETREAVAALVRRERGKVLLLLRKRPDRGLLGGLWELPGTPLGPR